MGFFTYLMRWYNSCRTCIFHCYDFLLLSGASCSLCVHHRKLRGIGIDVKYLNECERERTKLIKTYPKSCPQKLGMNLILKGIYLIGNCVFFFFFNQFYWQEVSNLLKKKPTCFKVGFLLFFRVGGNF